MTELEKANRRIAALERTLSRHVDWREDAMVNARRILRGSEREYQEGSAWWSEMFDQPKVVLS